MSNRKSVNAFKVNEELLEQLRKDEGLLNEYELKQRQKMGNKWKDVGDAERLRRMMYLRYNPNGPKWPRL